MFLLLGSVHAEIITINMAKFFAHGAWLAVQKVEHVLSIK
jgi:hypothetical protein